MKKLIAVTISGISCLQAYAADLPKRAAPPLFVPPVLEDNWSGCYVGGFGGVDIAEMRNRPDDLRANRFTRTALTVTPFGPNPPVPFVRSGNLFVRTTTVTNARAAAMASYGRTTVGGDGGGRVGCNYQTGRIVLGAQIEGGYLGINGTSIDPNRPSTASVISGGPYGALSGRIGYAVYPRTLLYVRGGVGYADLKYTTLDTSLGYNSSVRGSQAMPLVGAGIEYKVTPRISLTGEYTYMRPGCRTIGYTFATGTGGGTSTTCLDKHMVTLGLNYYFTPTVAPVVARY